MAGFLADKGRRILFNGYNVIPIKRGGKAPSIKNWETIKTTETDIQRWVSNGRAQDGVGITTSTTPLVDLDISDPEMNQKIVDWIMINIGLAPIRIGNPPKRGLPFQADKPFSKITSRAFTDLQGRKAQVEILGNGQQFVAYHTHPDTHEPYRWLGHDSPETIRADELPHLSQRQGQAIVAEFERLATEAGWPGQRRSTLPTLSSPDDEFGAIGTEPIGLTDDELRDALMAIPNDDRFDVRDDWLDIGFAVHHETGGSDYGRDLWHEWSEQHESHKEELFKKTWGSFGKSDDSRRPVTARFLLKLAKEARAADRTEQINALLKRFDGAKDIDELRGVAAGCRKMDVDLIDRSRLVSALQRAVRAATGSMLGVREAREMVRYRPEAAETPEWLEGWCYLTHAKRFFNSKNGTRVEREAFDAAFGRHVADVSASKYALDTVKIPVYHMNLYMPGVESVFTDASGLEWINAYTDRAAPPLPAVWDRDSHRAVETIEKHGHHLFTDARGVEILHSVIAYVAQTKKRVNWAVLLQGSQQIGKTFYASLMAAVLGAPHVYIVDTESLYGRFSGWAEGHLFKFIEELKAHGHNRYQVYDKLKPYITNDWVSIEPKGINPFNAPNTATYMAATNHRDALPIGGDDTRYFVLIARFQTKIAVDYFKDANPGYYQNLHKSLAEYPGAARKWLLEYKLHADFDPLNRAPESSGRTTMIEESRSQNELIIEDLIIDNANPLISNDLLVVHTLKELYMDDQSQIPDIIARPFMLDALLTKMGFVPISVKPRIDSVRYFCWSRNSDVINADPTTVRNMIIGRSSGTL